MWLQVLIPLFVSLVLDVYGAEFFDNNAHTKQLIHHLTESEKLFLFGSNPEDAQFDIAHYRHDTRRKRSLTNEDENLAAFKEHLQVQEHPKQEFLDPHFVLLKRWTNASDVVYRQDEVAEPCYYKSDRAAVFACGDVRGLVKANDSYYFIHPLPERFHSGNTKAHIVVKRSLDITQDKVDIEHDASCVERDVNSSIVNTAVKMWTKHRRKRDVSVADETQQTNLEEFKINLTHRDKTISNFIAKLATEDNTRQKRAVLPAIFVETAVFVDRDLYKHMAVNFPKDTERELVRFVLAMINAVQLIYNDPSLERPVNFILKRLEILHEDPANLKRPHDIDRFLSNFCTWQRLENPPGDSDPLHWDHALILTGLDLYVVNKNGKVSSQVVGLAPVAGMCTVTSSCTVNEGRHFESVYVVAHEIGHNLGMRHDGPLADNGCDPSAYIMSPTLGSGKITWSSCSNNYLRKFLDTSQSRCLLDHSSSAGQLDHGAEDLLPGERFNADTQCMLKFGRGSAHAPQREDGVCRDLHCKRDHYTWTSHPALSGTRCGPDMHCLSGECVPRAPAAGPAWAAWGAWSDCASACLGSGPGADTGLTTSHRKCHTRRHDKNSCQGHDKKYKSCYAQQCENVPQLSVQEFAQQICRRARDVDPELTGDGLQRLSEWSTACAVWCVTAHGGYKSRGWSLPDGSRCAPHAHAYCVGGTCRKFTCSSDEDAPYTLSEAECAKEMQHVTQSRSSSSWRRSVPALASAPLASAAPPAAFSPASACHFHCVLRGAGLRLVTRGNEHTIQLCHPSNGCSTLKSATQHASMVCTRYSRRVRRLSGLGVQVAPTAQDPDRPCRVACQDERVPHRFYLVNGQEGWFPLGTACGQRNNTYCVSGKCLEFGADSTPLGEHARTLPRRRRRSVQRAPQRVTQVLDAAFIRRIVSGLKLTGNATEHVTYHDSIPDNITVDFTHPIHISPDEAMLRKPSRPTWD